MSITLLRHSSLSQPCRKLGRTSCPYVVLRLTDSLASRSCRKLREDTNANVVIRIKTINNTNVKKEESEQEAAAEESGWRGGVTPLTPPPATNLPTGCFPSDIL